MESGKQGRWEGLGWHIALETEMNRGVNRRQRVLGEKTGRPEQARPLPRQGARQGGKQREKRWAGELAEAEAKLSLIPRVQWRIVRPLRRPGHTQAPLRSRVMVLQAEPHSGIKTPFPSAPGDAYSTLCRQNEGGPATSHHLWQLHP